MLRMCKFWIIFVVCASLLLRRCDASTWLQDPPSRSAAWYYQIQTPVNYNFRNLDCGNVPVKINSDGTRNCGLCGDPYTDPVPRENELGGKYANPRVRTRYYESGQVADISIWNNLPGAPGFYEFRLCDEVLNQTQACLDKHLLTIRETGTTYMTVPQTQGLVIIHLELPPDVTCDFCLLQWRFRKESLSGCDDENWCGAGRGAQIEYYNCADVMIGAVGQPKPTFIEDPVYTASDYGSAYDVATTRTTPDSGGLVGSTTQRTTTTTDGVPVFTIPTVFPTGTTNNPATTSGTTNNPASTSGTTNSPATTRGPITITTPGTTSSATSGPVPTNSRLVVDSNGNALPGQSTTGGRSANNKYLLVLLSLLPLFGAIGHQSRSPGVVPHLAVPPSAPVSWAQAVPVYPLRIENTFGFGNFRTGNAAAIGTGSYNENYGSNAKYSNTYSVSNVAVPVRNNFALNTLTSNSFGRNSGFVGNYPANPYNTHTYPNHNTGGTQLVQNPVVWKKNGVTINNGFTSHVFPRSINFQGGTPYHPSPNQYAKIPKSPLPQNEYGNNQSPGYAPHSNLTPHNPVTPARTQAVWPRNMGNNVNRWHSGGTGTGTRNLQTGVKSTDNKVWQNNAGFGTPNTVNINRAGTGQRVPAPDIVTQRMRVITPTERRTDNSFNLPGIESASRFRVNGPRKITETSLPMDGGGAVIQNGGRQLNGAFGRTAIPRNTLINNFNPSLFRTGTASAYDWYNLLFKRRQANPSRAL